MLFVAGKTIALSKSHTFEATANTLDSRTKDDATGPHKEFDFVDWSASSDGMIGVNTGVTNQQTYATLMGLMVAGTKVSVALELATNPNGAVPDNGWAGTSGDSATMGYSAYEGDALITSISLSADDGDNASMSIQLTGVSALTLQTAS